MLVSSSAGALRVPEPPGVFAGTPAAGKRFWEFFLTQISNDHTRRAYFNAAKRFAEWCAIVGLRSVEAVEPLHIAAFVRTLGENHSAPTVKQHLAALRMLFDWLVVGQVLAANPAHAVRGPRYSVKKGKTTVLSSEEMRILLDSIPREGWINLRDRALIGLMAYTFARIGAVRQMRKEDYFWEQGRPWVRLHEKGGKLHTLPCHPELREAIEQYLEATAAQGNRQAWLFPTCNGTRSANRTLTS